MTPLLVLNPRFELRVLPEAAVLLDGDDYAVLEGQIAVDVFRSLAERPCRQEHLMRQLGGLHPVIDLQIVLGHLVRDGFVVAAEERIPPAVATLAASLDVLLHEAALVLRQTRLALLPLGVDPSPFRAALAAFGFDLPATPPGGLGEVDLTVVLTRDYLDPRLAEINEAAFRENRSWMPVRAGGPAAWIGPLFVPGAGACLACLARRLRLNLKTPRLLQQAGTCLSGPAPEDVIFPTLTAYRTARELACWAVRGVHRELESHLMVLSPPAFAACCHPVQRLPDCPCCGMPAGQGPPGPPVFRPQPRVRALGGGSRTLPPEEAFARYEHLIDPLTGVLRNLRQLEMPSEGLLHVYTVEHPLVETAETLGLLRLNEGAGSSGKGRSPAQARASALFEGLERYSAVWRGSEYRLRASYDALRPEALHPQELDTFSERQVAARDAWNGSCPSPALRIPQPFDEHEAIDWVPAWSLTHGRFRYVPASYAYFGYSGGPDGFCFANSNGDAAGATLEEAVLQGFLELVERDAVALWFYNRLRRAAVALDRFGDAYFGELARVYGDVLDRELWVLDVTSDLGIPAVVALSRRRDRKPEDIIMGFGAHLDPHVAVGRALTEINQLLYGVAEEEPGGATRYRVRDPLARAWYETATLEQHPYLRPAPDLPPKGPEDYALLVTEDLTDDLWTCVRLAGAAGLETCVLDLSRPDLGVPVVKVIVPGLVNYWRRLGHRRLYEVPVRMGWLDAPREEAEMNPQSIVI